VQINHAGIARTFQNIRLFQNLSVLDNVSSAFNRSAEHGSAAHRSCRTPKFARERQAEAPRDGTAADAAPRRQGRFVAKNLPYGDQRRLEIARALATSPRSCCSTSRPPG
jgi:branched-chain amino acid transport system ATP-binding protein